MAEKFERREDRIMDAGFLATVASVSTTELRGRRDECRELEAELSYSRRLLQGKMDILADELRRRADGGEDGLEDLVSRLPSILADEPRGVGQNRLLDESLPANAGLFRREAERLAADLSHTDTMSVEGLTETLEHLAAAEKKVSEQRRAAQQLIDGLNGELVRRYKKGEADPSSLLNS